jgi:hypothetical protein
MPTARKNGCLASVGKNMYYSGSYYMDTTNVNRMEMLIGPCAVAAPTNGALGTCASSLAAGASCQSSCSDGYGVSGRTSCSARTGLLAAATCRTGAWISRNAVPAQSYMPAQGAGAYDTFVYTYIAGPQSFAVPANRGEFYKYASMADTWTTGVCPVLPRESVTPSTRSGVTVVGKGRLGGRACSAVCGLASLPSTTSEYRIVPLVPPYP